MGKFILILLVASYVLITAITPGSSSYDPDDRYHYDR